MQYPSIIRLRSYPACIFLVLRSTCMFKMANSLWVIAVCIRHVLLPLLDNVQRLFIAAYDINIFTQPNKTTPMGYRTLTNVYGCNISLLHI
jgi:hypothetical protein